MKYVQQRFHWTGRDPSTIGVIRYSHQILQAIIVQPDNKQVIPLAPEAIQNTEGTEKQDCEINAGKRFIKKFRKTHPKLKIIYSGDDLFSLNTTSAMAKRICR